MPSEISVMGPSGKESPGNERKTVMKHRSISIFLAAMMFAGCTQPSAGRSSGLPAASEQADETAETRELRIIATSDLHGKFAPWDYALNEESLSGSMEQLQSAVNAYLTENMLLVDAGDTIQDNAADIFLEEEVHPMILSLNAMDYDVWTVGNHEFNYGMDNLRKVIGPSKPGCCAAMSSMNTEILSATDMSSLKRTASELRSSAWSRPTSLTGMPSTWKTAR